MARFLALDDGLVVDPVLGAQRQMDAAHAFIRADIADRALCGKGAVHAKAEFAQPHFALVGADIGQHLVKFGR